MSGQPAALHSCSGMYPSCLYLPSSVEGLQLLAQVGNKQARHHAQATRLHFPPLFILPLSTPVLPPPPPLPPTPP